MNIGIVKETFPGERRVALTPDGAATLNKLGHSVLVESGSGLAAGIVDDAYGNAGATVVQQRADVFAKADVVCCVRTLGANREHGSFDLDHLRQGQTVIGLAEPLAAIEPTQQLADAGVMLFALELVPRITRAQAMDVLSSQANIAGYKAVLLAAGHLPRMLPMMMTAAGTITPARVFIIGAGVAGLQAIATARRLGAVVTAYDVRPVVREQVESLGAAFLEIKLDTETAEGAGGYAKAQDEAFYQRQQAAMSDAISGSDVVITTAAIPGKPSPRLVTAPMIERMQPGSVIVDLAAERGGNCEPTQADEMVDVDGVTILGPTNLPATVPYHASQMYSRNVVEFLKLLVPEDTLEINTDDEIIAATLLTRDGAIVQPKVREAFGLPDSDSDIEAVSAASEQDKQT